MVRETGVYIFCLVLKKSCTSVRLPCGSLRFIQVPGTPHVRMRSSGGRAGTEGRWHFIATAEQVCEEINILILGFVPTFS